MFENAVKHTTTSAALSILAGACFLRFLYLIVYRLYFHPLSKFPGPRLAAISDLWSVWYSIKGQSHLKSYEVHSRHGPVARFGPNKLSISSLNNIEAVYCGDSTLKSNVYATINPVEGAFSTFTSIDRSMHRRKRKVFSQAFSEQAIHKFEPSIQRHSDIFVEEITKAIPPDGKWSGPLNMTPRSRYYATDVMGEFGFGKSFDMQTSTENHFLIKATDGATVVAGMYCQYPKLKDYGMGRLVSLAGMATKEKFGRLARRLINDRLEDTSGSQFDLLHFVSNAQEKDGQSVSMDEVWAESRFTLIAGAETTGTAITATLFYLSRAPYSLTRLQNEIRSTFASPGDIKLGAELTQCRYLWACIDEAMRLSPSVVAILWRQVVVDDFIVEGEHLPRGCDIGFTSYVLHHDSDIFPEPFRFQPERWLADENDAEVLKQRRKAFTAFGMGPRKCIGLRMAHCEIALCIAKAMWMLDLRRPEGDLDEVGCGQERWDGGREKRSEFQLYEHITCRHDGPYLHWAVRKQ